MTLLRKVTVPVGERVALVEPHYRKLYGEKAFDVIHADVFEWKPPKGQKRGAVWFDIWSDLCEDNLPQMTKLKRKFGRRSDWKGCWSESFLRSRRR